MATLGSNIIVAAGGGDGHVKYTDAEAVAAVHTKYTDAEAIAAVEGEATLDLAGDVDVATGKTLSADGLEFPATQVASAGANTLDDYEEGTFTSEIGDDTLDGSGESQVYGFQLGRYTKVGNRCYFMVRVSTTSIGSLTAGNRVRILGLPFTSKNVGSVAQAIAVGTAGGISVTAGYVMAGTIDANTTYVGLLLWDAATGPTIFLVSEWTADGSAVIAGHYEVD